MQRALMLIGSVGAGVLLVLVVAAVVGDNGEPDAVERPATSFPAIDHDPAAAQELIVAWERWRTATFVSSGTWSRQLDGGGPPLEGPVYIAQRPPQRLSLRLGSVVEEIDGSIARCDLPFEDVVVPDCVESDSGRDFASRVADEMVLVEQYVSGSGRLYDVDIDAAGCFRAELEAVALRSPWGRWAEFCFDAESGALRSSRIRRPSAVDTEIIIDIRLDVTDDDFR